MSMLDLITRTSSKKTTDELIAEIHEDFFTEVDKLLADAKIVRSVDTDKQDLIDKCARLRKLGFTNTKEIKEAEIEIKRINERKEINNENKKLADAINYFSIKYPQYKFITEESVKKICGKYNLIYGEISRYEGDVPDKNLKHIEQFKIDENDMCFKHVTVYRNYEGSKENFTYVDKDEFDRHGDASSAFSMYWHDYYAKCSIEIAAPLSDFNIDGMELKDHKLSRKKIEIPDPVILNPVLFKGAKYYLIVTAWGIEASDENIVNEKMN